MAKKQLNREENESSFGPLIDESTVSTVSALSVFTGLSSSYSLKTNSSNCLEDDELAKIPDPLPEDVGHNEPNARKKSRYDTISARVGFNKDSKSLSRTEVSSAENVIRGEGENCSISPDIMGVMNKSKSTSSKKTKRRVVHNVSELREAILNENMELRDLKIEHSYPSPLVAWSKAPSQATTNEKRVHPLNVPARMSKTCDSSEATGSPFPHEVLDLIHKRYHSGSTPLSRASDDTSKLALAIEGGGVRGAVSGGMAAAISYLGLSDTFDVIYGSSAGSIVGSYFVSRQLYLDIYTEVIPAGKSKFVSKKKILLDTLRNCAKVMKNSVASPARESSIKDTDTRTGGLKTSFILDTIMCPKQGLRPLDMDSFLHNDAIQPLRVVSSAVDLETGKLKTVCFGSKERHFQHAFSTSDKASFYPEKKPSEQRRGLWACLQASMAVPGAVGSPILVDLPSGDDGRTTPHFCYDAFCHEPIPYRSAVAEGATHVLVLRSKPASYRPKTKPTLYHKAVAPIYFRSHGLSAAAKFFEKGGQQYLSAEDILTLDEGLESNEPVPVPPPGVLYPKECTSYEETPEISSFGDNRAHLFPITVPANAPELSTLCQEKGSIVAGIRSGFAAAYNVLAPIVGLDPAQGHLDGNDVARLIFPGYLDEEALIHLAFPDEEDSNKSTRQMKLPGIKIHGSSNATHGFDRANSRADSTSITCAGSADTIPSTNRSHRKRSPFTLRNSSNMLSLLLHCESSKLQ